MEYFINCQDFLFDGRTEKMNNKKITFVLTRQVNVKTKNLIPQFFPEKMPPKNWKPNWDFVFAPLPSEVTTCDIILVQYVEYCIIQCVYVYIN